MANGIIVIDKPQEWTSMDVCAKIRGVLHERRVGHAGTLDPMATGVLPVFVGRATRAVEFASESEKEYIAGLKLGVVTNTQDTTGQVVEERHVEADRAALEGRWPPSGGRSPRFRPCTPPSSGTARSSMSWPGGEGGGAAPRPVTIHALEVVEQTGPNCYTLRVRCSKGTYVRTLCHDIGAALGCGGCMSALRRTEAAGFSLAEAVPLEALLDAPDPAALLRPVDAYFFRYPAMTVEGTALRKAKNGNPFPCSAADGDWRVYGPGGEFLLLGRCAGGMVSTIKSFFEV